MFSIVRVIVAGFAVAAATVPGLAQQQKSLLHEISERGVLRVGTTGTYFPFSIRDAATNSFKGFDIEVAERIAKDLGVKVEFVQTTWPALVAGLVARKYDIGASGITITLERLKSVAFTDSYIRPAVVPIIRAADKSKYGKWQDLDKEGVRIAVSSAPHRRQRPKRNSRRPRSSAWSLRRRNSKKSWRVAPTPASTTPCLTPGW